VAKKLYVGNLSYGTTDSDLEKLFEPHGAVQSAQVIMDRESGRSKGFGFVEMDNGDQAQAAIKALNGQEVGGRALTVNEARPRQDRGGNPLGYGGLKGNKGGRSYQAVRAAQTPSSATLPAGCSSSSGDQAHILICS